MSTRRAYDRPRVYINWSRVREAGWRGWVAAVGVAAFALAALALIAIVASTLLAVAIVAAVIVVAVLFVADLFRRRKRDVGPYRGDYDA